MVPIGIDLGTTYSAVATVSGRGQPVVVKNSDGESTTPSVVYFPSNGPPIVGSEAKEYHQRISITVSATPQLRLLVWPD